MKEFSQNFHHIFTKFSNTKLSALDQPLIRSKPKYAHFEGDLTGFSGKI
jgi:hypothetical protein